MNAQQAYDKLAIKYSLPSNPNSWDGKKRVEFAADYAALREQIYDSQRDLKQRESESIRLMELIEEGTEPDFMLKLCRPPLLEAVPVEGTTIVKVDFRREKSA